MRKLPVFAAFVLCSMIPSCAERVVPPANIAPPDPASRKAAPNPQPNIREAKRQAAVIMTDAKKRLATRARQIVASTRTELRPEAKGSRSPTSQVPRKPERNIPSTAARPSPLEPAASTAPAIALLPPPPRPAEPTFPSAPYQVGGMHVQAHTSHLARDTPIEAAVPPPQEPAPAPEPATPPISGSSLEALLPPLPEPAEPSFLTAAQVPPPPELADPVLLDQESIAAETPVSIPLPELSESLSLRPRSDWRDVAETFSIPHSLIPDDFVPSAQRSVPSLVEHPWPLAPER
jgi:hypothetical protein